MVNRIKNVTAVIIVKNGERTIKDTLESVTMFDEVIVLDNGSIDSTCAICSQYKNVVIHEEITESRFNYLRIIADTYASNDTVLHIDADETLVIEAENPFEGICADVVYEIFRINIYKGKHIKYGVDADGNVTRIYNRTRAKYKESHIIHETLESRDGNPIYWKVLEGVKLIHNPMPSYSVILNKIQLYSTLEGA